MNNWLVKSKFFDDMFNSFDKIFDRYDRDFLNCNCSYKHISNEDRHKIEIEVPGVDEKDIDIKMSENRLSIKWTDRNGNKLNKSFGVYDGDASKIEASLDRGVLTLTVPKKEETKTKTIEVKINKPVLEDKTE